MAGEIDYFLRQVPFDLPGGIKYRLDFMVIAGGKVARYVDVKGFVTDTFRIKKKQVEEIHKIKLTVLKYKQGGFYEVGENS